MQATPAERNLNVKNRRILQHHSDLKNVKEQHKCTKNTVKETENILKFSIVH